MQSPTAKSVSIIKSEVCCRMNCNMVFGLIKLVDLFAVG